jgi:hypothetical protein
MSLATDSIFVTALQSNSELLEKLTEYIYDDDNIQYDETPRLYGTAIGLPDDDADNVSVPYVIVTFDGLTNDQGTSYNMYVQVQNELQRAVNELRDETALQYFGKKYDGLDSAAQRAVSQAIPMSISEAPPMDYSNTGK